MEKINPEQLEQAPEQQALPEDLREEMSGVFEGVRSLQLESPSHGSPQESVARILENSNLLPEEVKDLTEEAIEKLEELDKRETALKEETNKSIFTDVMAWAGKHRFAAALLIAGAVHSPVIARNSGFIERIEQAMKTAKDWERPGAFIRPQSDAERRAVIDKIHERGERVDQDKRTAYIDELRNKMESGENIKLNETYLKLEEVNGVDPERVKLAEQKKREMISRFASKMGDDFTEDFIRYVVSEMFGSNINYDWGQASAAEYFITGKRNCVAIARAEQMVFEALIDRLPAEKHSKYQLGNAFEKQHEIAILKVLNPDGSIDKTYFLQPPVNILRSTAERPGSPTVDLKTLQKALVAGSSVEISSHAKPGEIPPSPDIDYTANQPVPTNIKIQGNLRGSDYNERIVEEREIQIQWKEPSTKDEILDLEIIDNNDLQKARQKIEDAYGFIEANEPKCEAPDKCPSEETIDRAIPFTAIDLSFVDWKNLTPEQKHEIYKALYKVREMPGPDVINYGDINAIPREDLNKILGASKSQKIAFELKHASDGSLSLKGFHDLLSPYYAYKLLRPEFALTIHFDLSEEIPDYIMVELLENLPAGGFAFNQKNTVSRPRYSDRVVKAIVESKATDLFLEGADLSAEAIQIIIDNPNKTYHFGITAYMEILMKRPDVVKVAHIKPWIDKLVTSAELDFRHARMNAEQKALIMPVLEKLEEESIQKFYRAYQ
ncbi:MAG: hypothetical protein ACOYUZ_05215 [Patescibacteria group bacterium]